MYLYDKLSQLGIRVVETKGLTSVVLPFRQRSNVGKANESTDRSTNDVLVAP